MANKIIIPILNKKTITFKGPRLYLADNIYLDTISDEDFGAFHRDATEEHKNFINIKTKCIYIINPKFEDLFKYSLSITTIIKFVFNIAAHDHPMLFSFLSYFEGDKKLKLKTIINLDLNHHFQKGESRQYKIKDSHTRETISGFYKIVYEISENNPQILFSYDRYNTCLSRFNIYDQIVDATISLESLIESTNELKFKFSLYNSFLSSNDPNERFDNFKKLQTLYDVRSGIVHGDLKGAKFKRNLIFIQTNWEAILNIIRSSLTYYTIFLKNKSISNWKSHLENLVFNIESRITD